ncbi:hypothetical protein [Streptosporangium carneum]|uniref:Uncharacterized protein n=1 Tax=Streptosporangium carneum TaxID=47481 RepID=A0A9W6HXJ5_9ACTN|nr:hypothetical protein [Streptosporangium carneum]GLK08235.1 hypothetical protein GCM10017600_16400 [Streptosporangium carneum]
MKWQREAAQAQKVAAEAAGRSANADEKVAALTEPAHSEQISHGRTVIDLSNERHEEVVRWKLDRSKNRFILRNVGTAVATGVRAGGQGVARTSFSVSGWCGGTAWGIGELRDGQQLGVRGS